MDWVRKARSQVAEQKVAGGMRSKSETLGHQEFILTYKTFEPIGPACLPASARVPVVEVTSH